jgi:GAF domain-containing protein
LNQILVSAVEILRSEAGSLLLVDEVTDELVFVVTTGPVAGDLTGVRLPPGTGLVGKAVEARESVIDNNVQQSKDWFEKTDEDTGFITRALLVVPMEVREKVIGVIEVINKMDGSPFSPDDQRLLSAFTAQAAVAIENARLFTMTDQALAARVEELSVMQSIPRYAHYVGLGDASIQSRSRAGSGSGKEGRG